MKEDAFWKDFIAQEHVGRLEAGEKTPQMVADEIGKSRARAYEILREGLRHGKLTRRAVQINGRKCWAYKPVNFNRKGKNG